MKTYHFGYVEIIQNYKSIEVELDEDEDPETIADSLMKFRDHVQWNEDGEITNEFDINFALVSLDQG